MERKHISLVVLGSFGFLIYFFICFVLNSFDDFLKKLRIPHIYRQSNSLYCTIEIEKYIVITILKNYVKGVQLKGSPQIQEKNRRSITKM